MASVADDEPPSAEDLAAFQRDGRAWVAADEADRPVGYVLVAVVDDNAHVEQVSVHPRHAGRGLGRSLLDVVEEWARCRGLLALTLTTYAEVPWNAPYYQRLGFAVLADEEVPEGLRRVQAHEAGRGLAAWPRVAMRRPVRSG